jgi:hypothetical protein
MKSIVIVNAGTGGQASAIGASAGETLAKDM